MTHLRQHDPNDNILSLLARHEESHWWFQSRRKVLFPLLHRALSEQQPLMSLDVGCSTGTNLSWLNARGWAVGVDTNLDALRICMSRGLRALVCSDVLTLPFPDNRFHFVMALDLVEHVEDDKRAVKEIHRVVRPGGLAAFSVPAYNWMWSSLDEAGHRRRYSARSLRRVVEAAGFCIERLTYANTFLFPLLLLQRLWGKWRAPHPSRYLRPSRLDPALGWVFGLEARIIPHASFCFGGSLMCLARKCAS